MTKTSTEQNRAIVLEAFDTLSITPALCSPTQQPVKSTMR